jgi:hypothetical protein
LCCACCHRLKDIIYGFGTNNVYVVLECMDCDLRHLLDADRQLEMRQIKVSTPSLLTHGAGRTLPSSAIVLDIAQTAKGTSQQLYAWGILSLSVCSNSSNLQARFSCASGQGWLLALAIACLWRFRTGRHSSSSSDLQARVSCASGWWWSTCWRCCSLGL